jgi:inorganic pyrophosphatase/exopolyphosphatase
MTKEQISTAVQSVIDGIANPLEVLALIKEYEKEVTEIVKLAKEQIEEAAYKEALKYNAKTFEFNGYKVTQTEGRRMYNFKGIPLWEKAKEDLTKIETLSKMAADSYQKFGKAQIVTDDGEIVPPCEITFTNPSLSFTKLKTK